MKDFFAGLMGGIRELTSPGVPAVSCFAQVYDADSDIIDFSLEIPVQTPSLKS